MQMHALMINASDGGGEDVDGTEDEDDDAEDEDERDIDEVDEDDSERWNPLLVELGVSTVCV